MAYGVLAEAAQFSTSMEIANPLRALDQMLVGGEAFPRPLADDLLAVLTSDLINMYGPTETTIWSTCAVVSPNEATVSIGKPIANTQIHILDADLQPVPIGSTGEIFIGGKGLARGYFQRPELTSERFVPNPFAEEGERLYRTGDLGKFGPDGNIQYQGRTDFQVKIRGYRIELGEIENVVMRHHFVHEVAVLAEELSEGDQRLVAFFTAAAHVPDDELRSHCREALPEYMVPQHFVKLDALPQTPNGKIDRKALQALRTKSESPTSGETNRGDELEEAIAAIWSELLGTPRVDVTKNFFDLGGHSLLALHLHKRLTTEIAPSLQLTDIFRFPTVRTLSQFIGSQASPGEATVQDRAATRKSARSLRLERISR
jgi:acyl-CoA synthetase (AMP-forming)/AMP-acid ligase II